MQALLSQTRRNFLTSSACGLGAAGLASLLSDVVFYHSMLNGNHAIWVVVLAVGFH